MEQVKVGDLNVTTSSEVNISTSSFIDAECNQVVLVIAQYPQDGETKEAKCGRVYELPEGDEVEEVLRAMKREVLRELVTYLEMEGIL